MITNPLVPSYYSRISIGAGISSTFHEDYFQSNPGRRPYIPALHDWESFAARLARYDAFWRHFEASIYLRSNRWSDVYKRVYGLYEYTRSVLSPAARIGRFWATHLYAGSLDPEAGDGQVVPSACPIAVPRSAPKGDAIRAAVARIWRASNWQAEKEKYARFGAVCGDVALMPVDDPARGLVRLKVVHPSTIRELDRDEWGNVRNYVIEDWRPDPRYPLDPAAPMPFVKYNEVAERIGRAVRFATFLDDEPFDWRDYPGYPDPADPGRPDVSSWTEEYGFTPLVFVQHEDVGLGYGFSAFQQGLPKFNEVDDGASKLGDYVRKMVDCPWFFTGIPEGSELESGVPAPSVDDPHPERDRYPTFSSASPDAHAVPLVANLPIEQASAHYARILKEIEKDYPELEAITATGETSGRAMRVAKENVEARVIARRAGYDDGLARAQMMAITMGAVKGYDGFEGDFDGDSYDRGELFHAIGPRPVFALDEEDRLYVEQQRANALKTYRDAGMSLEGAMRRAGYPDQAVAAEIAAIERERERGIAHDRALAASRATVAAPATPGAGPAPAPGTTPGATGQRPAGGNNPGRPTTPRGPDGPETRAWREAQIDTTLGGVRR